MKPAKPPGQRWAINLAVVAGTPVFLHVSLVLVLGALMWVMTRNLGFSAAAYRMMLVLVLLACVAMHEVGHAVAARAIGITIHSITLYPFGGLARLGGRRPDAAAELKIAAAGPAVNLIIAAGFFAIETGLRVLSPYAELAGDVRFLARANLVLGLLNLAPLLPLDGGRIFRAILSTRIGWSRSTVWAASAGQITGVVLIGVGALHYPWLALAGLVILFPANSELRHALARRGFEQQTVCDVMITTVVAVPADMTMEDLASLVPNDGPPTDLAVMDGGRVVGHLQAARLLLIMADGAGPVSLSDHMTPVALEMPSSTSLLDALAKMTAQNAAAAAVVDDSGHLQGIVLRRRLQLSSTLWRRLLGDDEGASR